MKKISVTLAWTKETKGTHQYTDAEEGAPIPTLYIKKDGADFKDGSAPKSLKIEISEGK